MATISAWLAKLKKLCATDVEIEIANLLEGAENLDSSVAVACAQFEIVLANVLGLVSKKHPLKLTRVFMTPVRSRDCAGEEPER